MDNYRVTFINPDDPEETVTFAGEVATIEDAIKQGRDALFLSTPLRAETWVIKLVELV